MIFHLDIYCAKCGTLLNVKAITVERHSCVISPCKRCITRAEDAKREGVLIGYEAGQEDVRCEMLAKKEKSCPTAT